MFVNGTGWTEERIELLKSGIGRGLSAGQIAREIGVSRNAVIGKISRLKLNTGSGRCSGESKVQRRGSQNQILRALRAEVQPEGEDVPIHNGHRCSLLELTEENC